MSTAIAISELGMINDMRMLDVISNNLANANTEGFKRDIAVTRSFEQLLSQANGAGPQLISDRLVPPLSVLSDHSAGVVHQSRSPLDFAIEGDGYFELSGNDGAFYSRKGAFHIDATGALVNSQGLTVSGVDGEILLQGGEVTVDRDGTIKESGEYVGQIKLVTFDSPEELERMGNGLWKAGAQSAKPATESGVRQGYQEASNVKPMDEMVQMMETLRHFEATSQVIKGYDDIMGTAISTIAEF
ncbi:flagellar hook-basal body protein [Marinobacterium sp. D7]|uniref:flagellar hook-basal body protein n=1 Tax=Marinobacterium ramblicola TaxID=2849041 RepID=UPI001C2D9CA0|nr:flagellar hook-basal body protein [Marinobacterium ramblicola]MBV1787733.1 flagellar hook-basal body protein [Marinobacterium ramblicola]